MYAMVALWQTGLSTLWEARRKEVGGRR